MRARIRLVVTVIMLCVIGLGVAFYKNIKLGVPLLVEDRASSWLIEGKVSFLVSAPDNPATVRLALPTEIEHRGVNVEAGSLGFEYIAEHKAQGVQGLWTTHKAAVGNHALYFRLRFPENFAWESVGHPVSGGKPECTSPGFPEAVDRAAEEVIQRAKENSADAHSLFMHLMKRIVSDGPSQELMLIRRYFMTEERVEDDEIVNAMGISLLNKAGIPARQAYGLKMDPKEMNQSPISLIEYCDGERWHVRDPQHPNRDLALDKIYVWARGGLPLLTVFGGENSKVSFTVIKDHITLEKLAQLRESSFLTATILGLPVSERAVFSYVVLIPLGAFVVVVMRNLIGIATLGTFMPVLLALAFLGMSPGIGGLLEGIVMFAVIVGIGLYCRFLLSSMNLLVVPRVAACVVIVTLLMLFLSLLSWKLGIRGGLQITLFPMIIIAWTLERMSLIWEEEGKRNAIVQVSGSVIVAVCAFLVMKVPQIEYWAKYFPELLLVLLAAIILLGRYTGYRLSELVRFRHFS